MSLQTIKSEYKQLTDIQHILLRSEMYSGSRELTEMPKYLLHADGKIYPENIKVVPAALLFANELICNSYDEAVRTRKPNSGRQWQITTIDVVVDLRNKSLRVFDDGGIKVAIDSEMQVPIPVAIFGQLRTGSNYTDDRGDLGGQNGIGAKICNVFSKAFHIYTADGVHSLQQTWQDNMQTKLETHINECKDHFTELIAEFDTDTTRTKLGPETYDETWARCIEMRCMEIAAMSSTWEQPLTVKFKCIKEDGTEWFNQLCFKRFEDYLSYWPDQEHLIVDKQYRFAIAMSESIGSQESSAVVNALQCPWGRHIDKFVDACVWHIRNYITNKYHGIDIKPARIKSHIKTVSIWEINAPVFSGQTKELLVSDPETFGMPVIPSEQFIKKLLRSQLVQSIIDELRNRINAQRKAEIEAQQKELDKKVKKNVMPSKLVDAANAGRKPEDCELYIVEGDSAAGGLKKCRNAQTQGILAMFGKSCGCMFGRDEFAVLHNKALMMVMQALGLSFTAKNRLRYDKIIIATDADVDGTSICCLLLTFFNQFFPELIEQGKIYRLRTPIMTALNLKTGERKHYYKQAEYQANKQQVAGKDWHKAYIKGLATLSDDDYDIVMSNPQLVRLEMDELAQSSIAAWFGNDSSYRKQAMAIGDIVDDTFYEQLNNETFEDENTETDD